VLHLWSNIVDFTASTQGLLRRQVLSSSSLSTRSLVLQMFSSFSSLVVSVFSLARLQRRKCVAVLGTVPPSGSPHRSKAHYRVTLNHHRRPSGMTAITRPLKLKEVCTTIPLWNRKPNCERRSVSHLWIGGLPTHLIRRDRLSILMNYVAAEAWSNFLRQRKLNSCAIPSMMAILVRGKQKGGEQVRMTIGGWGGRRSQCDQFCVFFRIFLVCWNVVELALYIV
jgi:hypothetical protein